MLHHLKTELFHICFYVIIYRRYTLLKQSGIWPTL